MADFGKCTFLFAMKLLTRKLWTVFGFIWPIAVSGFPVYYILEKIVSFQK